MVHFPLLEDGMEEYSAWRPAGMSGRRAPFDPLPASATLPDLGLG